MIVTVAHIVDTNRDGDAVQERTGRKPGSEEYDGF